MSEFNKISDGFSACGQLSPMQINTVLEAGFKSIICNRPDDEAPLEPSSGDVFEAANSAGMQTAYLPMGMGQLTLELIEETIDALAQLPKPILAYCGSGKRAAVLWCFANVNGQGCDAVLEASEKGGFDLHDLRPMLQNFCSDT